MKNKLLIYGWVFCLLLNSAFAHQQNIATFNGLEFQEKAALPSTFKGCVLETDLEYVNLHKFASDDDEVYIEIQGNDKALQTITVFVDEDKLRIVEDRVDKGMSEPITGEHPFFRSDIPGLNFNTGQLSVGNNMQINGYVLFKTGDYWKKPNVHLYIPERCRSFFQAEHVKKMEEFAEKAVTITRDRSIKNFKKYLTEDGLNMIYEKLQLRVASLLVRDLDEDLSAWELSSLLDSCVDKWEKDVWNYIKTEAEVFVFDTMVSLGMFMLYHDLSREIVKEL